MVRCRDGFSSLVHQLVGDATFTLVASVPIGRLCVAIRLDYGGMENTVQTFAHVAVPTTDRIASLGIAGMSCIIDGTYDSLSLVIVTLFRHLNLAPSQVMYLGHFVLHSVQRIRFGLSLLTAARPQPPVHRVEVLSENRGLFVHHSTTADHDSTTATLLWFHAGAYLSGCPRGNVGVADAICTQTSCNVFLPTYRLAPEHSMHEIMEDVMNAYAWVREHRPQDTVLVGGWSAGAALAMRLLQEVSSQPASPIAAAVLCSPFCRYALPDPDSTMIQYAKHDWLVTQGVSRVSFDTLQLESFWGGDPDVHSPLDERNLRQLRHTHSSNTKILVVVSEHEAVYDETCELIRLVRKHTNIPVTVGQWRYMPHGWYM